MSTAAIAIAAEGHLAQAKSLRKRAEDRPMPKEASEVIWAMVFAHQDAAEAILNLHKEGASDDAA